MVIFYAEEIGSLSLYLVDNYNFYIFAVIVTNYILIVFILSFQLSCVLFLGVYVLKLMSCHKFDKEEFVYDTQKNVGVLISASVTKHSVCGTILSPESVKDLTVKLRCLPLI